MSKANNGTQERYTVSVVETFIGKDKVEKKRWHTVGVAFPWQSGKGLVVQIVPGLSVSGSLVISPADTEEAPRQ